MCLANITQEDFFLALVVEHNHYSAACSTACLSDTKTRLYSCSRWRNLLISEEAAIIVFFGQEKNCSAAHRAKNSIMSCNMLAAHIIVLLAALLVWVMLMKRRQGFLLGCGAAECCLNDDTTQRLTFKREINITHLVKNICYTSGWTKFFTF